MKLWQTLNHQHNAAFSSHNGQLFSIKNIPQPQPPHPILVTHLLIGVVRYNSFCVWKRGRRIHANVPLSRTIKCVVVGAITKVSTRKSDVATLLVNRIISHSIVSFDDFRDPPPQQQPQPQQLKEVINRIAAGNPSRTFLVWGMGMLEHARRRTRSACVLLVSPKHLYIVYMAKVKRRFVTEGSKHLRLAALTRRTATLSRSL